MADKKITAFSTATQGIDTAKVLGVVNGEAKLINVSDIGGGGGNVDVDTTNKWLLVSEDGHNYFVQLTELTKPNKPTISTTTYTVITGNVSVPVSSESGTTVKYSLNGGTSWSTGSTISIASGFTNTTNNTTKTQSVSVKAIKNGVESDVNEYTITINPKVKAGSVSFTRTPNNNDYATSATITFTASDMSGTTSRYSIDSGSTWVAFTGSHTETTNTSQNAGKYRVKIDSVTGYTNADVAQSNAITLNKKKFYYGAGGATLANEAAILALTGGGSVEQSTMAGSYDVTVTEQTVGSYIWFCGTGTLSGVTSSTVPVPMAAKVTVDGYNCYRTSSAQIEAGTNTFDVV